MSCMKAWLQGCATQWTCMHLAELVTGACTPLTCLLHAHLSQMHITASCHPPTSHASALHVCLCYSTETDKLPSLQLSRKKNQNHVRDPTKWTMQTNLTWCVWVHGSHQDKSWNCPLYCKVFSTFSMQSLNTGCTASSFSVQKKRTFCIPFSSNKGKMRLTHVGPILKVWIWMKHKDGELWEKGEKYRWEYLHLLSSSASRLPQERRSTLPPSGTEILHPSQWKRAESVIKKHKCEVFKFWVQAETCILRSSINQSLGRKMTEADRFLCVWKRPCVCVVDFQLLARSQELIRPACSADDLTPEDHHVWDCWLMAEVDFPRSFALFILHIHTHAQTHTSKFPANRSWTPALSPGRKFDWFRIFFSFLQAFRFNMQLEHTSPCVHACVCLHVSGLSCTVWESIQLKTLLSFLYLLLQSACQSPS